MDRPLKPPLTLHQRRSSLDAQGRRLTVRVGDVSGRWTRLKRWGFAVLIAIYAAAPLIRLNGAPLVFLDILQRRFYLFGGTYNAQDAYLLWPFLAGGLLLLITLTTLWGRVWCGYACPQTVFLEGVFRRLERWVEGPKHAQLALARAPWSLRKLGLRALKHSLYVLAALAVAHIFLSYFVSLEQLRHWVLGDPREHWLAFTWMAAISGALYFNFAWFREQTCLILCPYGRLQSALTDDDTLTVSYDPGRGEPRGRKGTAGAGDCVNCFRCVDVCPTGIDIREGLQMDCVACAGCIDACDDVMLKLGRAPGLIRYESLNGLQGKDRQLLRPRLALYAGALALVAVMGGVFLRGRRPFEANLIRQQGLPYALDHGVVRNQYLLHVVNKTSRGSRFRLELLLPPGAQGLVPVPELELQSLQSQRVPLDVSLPQSAFTTEFEVIARTTDLDDGRVVESKLPFLGPR
jgi:cytochrome c oxidase accessory protein FixG